MGVTDLNPNWNPELEWGLQRFIVNLPGTKSESPKGHLERQQLPGGRLRPANIIQFSTNLSGES
jgi:hypothetical protein